MYMCYEEQFNVCYENFENKIKVLIRFFAGKTKTLHIISGSVKSLDQIGFNQFLLQPYGGTLKTNSLKIIPIYERYNEWFEYGLRDTKIETLACTGTSVDSLIDMQMYNDCKQIDHNFIRFYERYKQLKVM